MGAKGGAVRQENYRVAAQMRANGLRHHEIAEMLGLSRSYVSALFHDPDGSKDRARKASYGGSCEVCGKNTDGSNGRSGAPVLCLVHWRERQHHDRYWTRERVLDGLRRLARDVAPRRPVATDILKSIPVGEDGRLMYPPSAVIRRELGSWANALEAIGFDRPRPGIRTPEGQARVTEAHRQRWLRS